MLLYVFDRSMQHVDRGRRILFLKNEADSTFKLKFMHRFVGVSFLSTLQVVADAQEEFGKQKCLKSCYFSTKWKVTLVQLL